MHVKKRRNTIGGDGSILDKDEHQLYITGSLLFFFSYCVAEFSDDHTPYVNNV